MILSQTCTKLLVIDLPERVMIKMIWILIGYVGEGSNELVSVFKLGRPPTDPCLIKVHLL